MIQKFVDAWERQKLVIKAGFKTAHPDSYVDIVKSVISAIYGDLDTRGEYDIPDPRRIDSIGHGDYQGTLLFVIGANGCRPDTYWYVKVRYGNCSGYDTLQAIKEVGDWNAPPTERQVKDYMTLALRIVQGLKLME